MTKTTFVTVRQLTVRRDYQRGTYEKLDGSKEPCFTLSRNCGLGCTCTASTWFRNGNPSVESAENKTLCFNDRTKQGISEIKGTGRAIEEGPDKWIYEVQAELVEARK